MSISFEEATNLTTDLHFAQKYMEELAENIQADSEMGPLTDRDIEQQWDLLDNQESMIRLIQGEITTAVEQSSELSPATALLNTVYLIGTMTRANEYDGQPYTNWEL